MNNDKNKKYWFKRRRYGYGWMPVTWQGWLTIAVFLAAILSGTMLLKDTPRNTFSEDVLLYLAFVVVAVAALLVISYMKGPKPRWRWGRKDSDKPDEDI